MTLKKSARAVYLHIPLPSVIRSLQIVFTISTAAGMVQNLGSEPEAERGALFNDLDDK